MLRPLNSATARTMVRMSAPSTSMLKVPVPVRTRPTCCMVPDCAAAVWAVAAPSHAQASRTRPTLPSRIGLISLPRQWNGYRLSRSFGRDADDDGVAAHRLDDTVHDLVPHPEHHARAAAVLDHGELVLRAPHDAHHLHAAHVHRGVSAHIHADELAADHGLE